MPGQCPGAIQGGMECVPSTRKRVHLTLEALGTLRCCTLLAARRTAICNSLIFNDFDKFGSGILPRCQGLRLEAAATPQPTVRFNLDSWRIRTSEMIANKSASNARPACVRCYVF